MRQGSAIDTSSHPSGVSTFNPYQFEDLLTRSQDQYANAKYRIIAGYLRGSGPLRVLNAGCGSGELSLILAALGHTVVGIDPAPEYIDVARRNADRAGMRACVFEVSTIEQLGAERTFDCVVATDVLEHIEDDRAAIRKLSRLVRPDGKVIITVPAGPWLFGFHDEALGHFRRYTRASLRRLCREVLVIHRLRYFGFTLIPVCLLYSRILRRPYPVAETGDTGKNPAAAGALRTLLRLDAAVPAPAGTSLLLEGVPRAEH
jgi:2-polyprenyl-3-methyl-5-hydroxy-6-metoxy-1,4-benzoquinol methylase